MALPPEFAGELSLVRVAVMWAVQLGFGMALSGASPFRTVTVRERTH